MIVMGEGTEVGDTILSGEEWVETTSLLERSGERMSVSSFSGGGGGVSIEEVETDSESSEENVWYGGS